jgi:hypothetical protein
MACSAAGGSAATCGTGIVDFAALELCGAWASDRVAVSGRIRAMSAILRIEEVSGGVRDGCRNSSFYAKRGER